MIHYGNHTNPNTDEARLYAALQDGATLTSLEIVNIIKGLSLTPVTSGLRTSLRKVNDPMKLGRAEFSHSYRDDDGKICKVYNYKLVPRERVEVAA